MYLHQHKDHPKSGNKEQYSLFIHFNQNVVFFANIVGITFVWNCLTKAAITYMMNHLGMFVSGILA